MALRILVGGSGDGPASHVFDDEVETIRVGRDPERNDVVLDAEDTRIGRQHFELRHVLGRYRITVNPENPVFLRKRRLKDGAVLPARARLTLGRGGPEILVETVRTSRLRATRLAGPAFDRPISRMTRWRATIDAHRKLTAVAAGSAIVAAAVTIWMATTRASPDPGELHTPKERLRELAGRHASSVALLRIDYNVLLEEEDRLAWEKDRSGEGTAFVVIGSKRLVTCRHVVDPLAFVKASDAELERLCRDLEARYGSTGWSPVVREICVWFPGASHPDEALRLSRGEVRLLALGHLPATRPRWKAGVLRRHAHEVVDLAVLEVDRAPDGAGLPLSPGCAGLKPQDVGLIGYPDGADGFKTESRIVTPTTVLGDVTGVGHWVQTNITTHPGNSGGPIFNANGQVIAIMGMRATGETLSRGIKVDALHPLLESIAAGPVPLPLRPREGE